MRAQVINQPKASVGLRETLGKYYRVLSAMESRFPVSNAPDHVNLSFTWYDAFQPTKHSEQANLHFEKAAIGFNIAAAISQYALESDRRTEAGLSNAVRLFQEAAGAFAYLRDATSLKVDAPRPIDLSPECAAMLERLMLAQAQECVLEKGIAGGKQPATLARLAKQVALFYDDTSRLLSSKPLSDHFDRSWQAHAAVKSLLFHLEADLQNAAHLRDEDFIKGVANEIAQLKASKISLDSAKKEAKSASKELQENVVEKERLVSERLAKAERENSMVYLQRIPAAADLPGVTPACLVKAVTPSDIDLTVSSSSDKLFKGVVPESTTRALSKYTDMVDSLIRKQTDALDAASDEARLKLREWELPESLLALEPEGSVAALPDAVRLDLEKVEQSGGLPHLQDLTAEIRNLRAVTSSELDAADDALHAEAREDNELRAHYGARWRRIASSQLNKQMLDKVEGYSDNLKIAGASDEKLANRLAAQAPAFGALDLSAVAKSMPRLQAPMLSVDNMEPAAGVAALRAGLEGLATLSSQRAALEQALKERKAGDDVLPKLLASTGDMEILFKTELAKYDDLVKGVEENVTKQRQMLDAVAAANSTFKENYSFSDWRRQCETAAQKFRALARDFNEIAGNLSEGIRFYTSLQDAIAALRQQVGDYCMTRKVQRDELLDSLKHAAANQEAAAAQHLANMSLQQSGSGGYQQSQAPQQQQQQQPYQPSPQPQQYVQPQQYAQQQQSDVPHWPPPLYNQGQQGQWVPPPPPPQQQPQQGYMQQPPPPPLPAGYSQQQGGGYQGQGGGQYSQYASQPPQSAQQQQQQHPSSSTNNNPLSNMFGFGRR